MKTSENILIRRAVPGDEDILAYIAEKAGKRHCGTDVHENA